MSRCQRLPETPVPRGHGVPTLRTHLPAADIHAVANAPARFTIISAAFSAIIKVGEFVFPDVMNGMIDASTTRKRRG